MPTKPEQDIMNEGPGLRQRTRETGAVLNTVSPVTAPVRPVTPSPKDKVNPKGGAYGSRPGEKRLDLSDIKPLGTFHKGTDFVPKTGNYTLEKGEAVVSKEKNMAASNPYKMVTEGDKSPKKTLKSIHTRKAKDGSYIHEHHHHHPAHKMEEHTSPDMKGAMAHMEEHGPSIMPEQPEEQNGAQAQASAVGMPTAGQ